MEKYIQGNKEAWEEAFDLRDPNWCADINERINEPYVMFYDDMKTVLKKYDLKGKSIGQFCCNNGRELMSLVKTTGAKEGIGFDIAENMVAYGNDKARELDIPCEFVATNILEIGDEYLERFDFVLITIGATCWFKSLYDYFAIVSKCMKKGACIVISEVHPFSNMIATEGDEEYDPEHPFNCVFSYFEHEWVGNYGMSYIVGRNYESKTFTDYTHSMTEMLGGLCKNEMVVTNLEEYAYDISNGLSTLSDKDFPVSMIIEGKKL